MMPKNSKNIKIAIVGLGYWGPNLLRNFVSISGAKVMYGCDLIKENLNKLEKSFQAVKFTSNFEDILIDKSVDVIAIATPLRTHYDLAKKSLEAKKHVLIEKPMTSTSREADDLIKIAQKNKRIIMVSYPFVYSEPIKKIKKLINGGALGKIYYYDSTRINLGLLQTDMDVLWDLACHDLSILSSLFSKKPVSVQSFGSKFINNINDEIAHVIIKYENNMTAHINVSWLSPVKIRSILIGGSKQMIVYDDISPNEKVRIYEKSIKLNHSEITPFSPAYRSGDVVIPYLPQNESLKNELEHLLDCIRNNKQPITDGKMGLEIVKLLEACDKSLELKSEVKI